MPDRDGCGWWPPFHSLANATQGVAPCWPLRWVVHGSGGGPDYEAHGARIRLVASLTSQAPRRVSGRQCRDSRRWRDHCNGPDCAAVMKTMSTGSCTYLARVSNIRPQRRRLQTLSKRSTGERAAGSPVEDAGAEGDSRKQREEEQNEKKKNTSPGRMLQRARHGELVERTSVPRVFSRSPCDREQAKKQI